MKRLTIALLALSLALAGCGRDEETTTLSGSVMGTTWSVTIRPALSARRTTDVQKLCTEELLRLESIFSTWDPESELSAWNQNRSSDWIAISPEFAEVMSMALEVGNQSDGAYDPTILPLVRLWGYGPRTIDSPPPLFPSPDEIAKALARCGLDKVAVRLDPPALLKTLPELELDLSGIAKGYATDRLADLLLDHGETDVLVEVGGEISARSSGSKAWQAAIQLPGNQQQALSQTIPLREESLATSGTYYQNRGSGERSTTHVIDPRSGYPIRHDTVSVSVIHENGAHADAWATALLVLGREDGSELAKAQSLEALFLERDVDAESGRPEISE